MGNFSRVHLMEQPAIQENQLETDSEKSKPHDKMRDHELLVFKQSRRPAPNSDGDPRRTVTETRAEQCQKNCAPLRGEEVKKKGSKESQW